MYTMATNESQSPDTFPGVPKVTPDEIHALKAQPNSLEDRFNDLQHDNPELARELFVDAHNNSKNDMDKKRAYAAGALFMYGLWLRHEQDKVLGSLFQEVGFSDGDVDEAPQL